MLASLTEAVVGGIIGATATLAAVLLGIWLPRRYALRDRTRQEASRLREEGAAAVEPVRHLLIEARPNRLILKAGPRSRSDFEDFWTRWRQLRDRLMTFASGQSSREVLVIALQLREAVERSLMSSAWAVQEALSGPPTAESVEAAAQDHAKAVELAHALRWKIRGEEAPEFSLYDDDPDLSGPSIPVKGPIPELPQDDPAPAPPK